MSTRKSTDIEVARNPDGPYGGGIVTLIPATARGVARRAAAQARHDAKIAAYRAAANTYAACPQHATAPVMPDGDLRACYATCNECRRATRRARLIALGETPDPKPRRLGHNSRTPGGYTGNDVFPSPDGLQVWCAGWADAWYAAWRARQLEVA